MSILDASERAFTALFKKKGLAIVKDLDIAKNKVEVHRVFLVSSL